MNIYSVREEGRERVIGKIYFTVSNSLIFAFPSSNGNISVLYQPIGNLLKSSPTHLHVKTKYKLCAYFDLQ